MRLTIPYIMNTNHPYTVEDLVCWKMDAICEVLNQYSKDYQYPELAAAEKLRFYLDGIDAMYDLAKGVIESRTQTA